jgi:hypothetical protein
MTSQFIASTPSGAIAERTRMPTLGQLNTPLRGDYRPHVFDHSLGPAEKIGGTILFFCRR